MKKIFKPFIFGLLTLVASAGVYFNQTNIISFNSDDVVVTEKQEATHTSNYSDYTYSGSYYDSIDITSLTNNVGGTLRKALTSLAYPKGWHEYYTDATGTLSDKLQKSDADPDNNSNMIYFYTRNSVAKTYSNGGSSWNREHVWCQSLSNGHWGTDAGAGSDLFHIRPEYASVNSSRSNTPYGEFTGGTQKIYNSMTYGYVSGGKFKPLAANKGDIARILMYIYVIYYDTYSSNRPDLLDIIESYDTLLTWHTNDKPDKLEGNRNNYVYRYTNQKNRNPFVDHPEYAWHIFGNKCSSGVLEAAKKAYPDATTTSSDSSGSGSNSGTGSSPSEGALKGSKQATYEITSTSTVTESGSIPSGSSATYSSTYSKKYQLTSGNSMTLTLKGYTNMIVKGMTFTMKSNTSGGAASLLVKAGDTNLKNMQSYSFSDSHWYNAFSTEYVDVGIGMTNVRHTTTADEDITITITSTENSVYISKIVVGYDIASTLDSIELSGMTTTYNVGDTFSFDGKVIANYTTGESKEVTPTSVSSPDMSLPGTKPVTVSYTEGTKTASKNYSITVNATEVETPDATVQYYEKVISTPSSLAGTYLIVNETNSVAFNGALTKLDAAGNNFSVNIENNMIAYTTEINNASFTISSSGTIKSKSGYYIGQTSDDNGLASSTSTSYTNTFTFNNGEVDIVSGGAYLRFNSSSNNLRFRYYKSETYTKQKAIALYKLVDGSTYLSDAETWATNFLNSLTCDNGKTAPSVTIWNKLAASFNSLTSQTKNIFITTSYTNDNVGKAVERYDYIVDKYGVSTYTPFMNRSTFNSNHILQKEIINVDSYVLFEILGITSLFIPLIFVLKKRKYNNISK